MKILCATDFSERSEAAVRIAAALARWSNGSLELVHVLPRPEMGYAALATDSLVLAQEIRENVRQKLSNIVAGVTDSARLSPTAALLEGRPHEAIVSHARQIKADLVVMGAHGGPALDRLVLGSVAERTVRDASLPVLIVPPGAPAWDASQEKAPRFSVIAALDGRPSSAGPVAFLRRLRAFLPCDLTVLRLYWPSEEYTRLGLTGNRELAKADPAVVADLELGLRELVGVLPGGGSTTFAIEPTWGEPAARLLDAALARHGDLVVIGTESRHGFARLAHPAVADHMARAASGVPVLFVPSMTPPAHLAEVPRLSRSSRRPTCRQWAIARFRSRTACSRAAAWSSFVIFMNGLFPRRRSCTNVLRARSMMRIGRKSSARCGPWCLLTPSNWGSRPTSRSSTGVSRARPSFKPPSGCAWTRSRSGLTVVADSRERSWAPWRRRS